MMDERRGTEVHAALRAGATGQLARAARPAQIVAALQSAAVGMTAIDPAALGALLGTGRGSDATSARRVSDALSRPVALADADARPGPPAAPLGTSAAGAPEPDPGDPALTEPPASDEERPRRQRMPARDADALSPREMELLRYLAEGYTNKEIARVMVLADDTVKKGVQSLIAKLGAADRTHAVVLALRNRVID
jgi:DNA-binding NarL/FixJ family response regulator